MTTEMTDEDAFYCALGHTIAQWAVVEQSLFKLYGEIMKPQIWIVTSATYHVQQTFRAKLNLVDMALKASYPDKQFPELRESWKNLSGKMTKISGKRNDLAHLVVGTDPDLVMILRPDPFNAKAMLKEDYKSKTYYIEDIKSAESEFKELSHEVDGFTRDLPPPPLLRRQRSRKQGNDPD